MKKAALSLCALAVSAALIAPVSAHEAGDIIVRAGALNVSPHESSDDVLGLGEFNLTDNTQLGLTFSYMVTDNWGVELVAATPFNHSVSLNGVGKIASAKHLPPTLLGQYYFGQSDSAIRPYVGLGVNYTFFFDEDFSSTGKSAGLSDLDMSSSWGLAAEAGVDLKLTDNIYANASVWYMDIDTDVTFNAGGSRQKIKTEIDPVAFMIGAGYRF
ncbi:outer membrane protein OmpW [Pokkaliibacter sp. CJK22405]|uniref:outer membrane protein OmpW n=1 Tax=Pokkaliibacter sp. CJK22405 TaxID=3384615 RepID=UPI0039846222